MYLVIGGAGEVGYQVALNLCEEGHQVVLIDRSENACARAEELDALVIKGNAANQQKLEDAGIEKAEVYIGVTGRDEINLLSCVLAKQRGCKTVARLNKTDYLDEPVSDRYKDIGVDISISPDLVTARRISRMLRAPMLADAEIFAKGKVQVLDSMITPESIAANRKIKDTKFPNNTNLVAILRGDDVIIPCGEDRLQPEDRIIMVLGNPKLISRMEKFLGGKKVREEKLEKVMIAGATRPNKHLARLLQNDISITLIDRSSRRCEQASEELNKTRVVCGDEVDKDVLVEEGIKGQKAFVAATEKDERNLLSCLLAKSLGVGKTIALFGKLEAKRFDYVDLGINPKLVTTSAILERIRKSSLLSFKMVKETEAQVLEFNVLTSSRVVGKKLRTISFPRDSIVGAIVRGEKVLIPRGDDRLQIDDKVVVFVKTTAIPRLERLF